MLGTGSLSVATRQRRSSLPAREYTLILTGQAKDLFGSNLLTTIATTANVALDLKGRRKLSREKVHTLIRQLGIKKQKTHS